MTRTEHLLTILAEECAEVAQEVAKALRFGPTEIMPGQPLNNAQRIKREFVDLLAVYGMLCREGVLEAAAPMDEPAIAGKQERVESYLEFSRECGTLSR